MSRVILALCWFLSAAASRADAQFEVSGHAGVHVDRAREADRVVTDGGAAMYATAGEASAFGLGLGYWIRPTVGFQLDLSRSSNASWEGFTPLPAPSFANRTTYLSARAAVRTTPARQLQLLLSGGPALMFHSGTGTNLRTRDTDLGGVIDVGVRLRLASWMGMQLMVSNYLYSSEYRSGGDVHTGGTFRHDLLLIPGVVFTW